MSIIQEQIYSYDMPIHQYYLVTKGAGSDNCHVKNMLNGGLDKDKMRGLFFMVVKMY